MNFWLFIIVTLGVLVADTWFQLARIALLAAIFLYDAHLKPGK